jgi:hypothetical protein
MRYAWVRMAISRPALCAVTLLVGCGGRTSELTVGSGSGDGSSGTSGVASAGTATGASGSGASSNVMCGDHPATLVQPFWSQPKITEEQVGDVAVIGTNVYFTLYGPSSLWRVPIGGGQPTMLTSITGEEDAMIATPTTLVIAESGQGMNAEIVALSIADGVLSTIAPSNGTVSSLVSDGVDVYFSDNDGTKGVPLTGGSARTLTSQKGTLGLAGSNVVLADGVGGNIFSIPKTGGGLATLSTNQPGARAPIACGADLCWTNAYSCAGPRGVGCGPDNGEGAIVRMSVGGAPVMLAQDALLYLPTALVFDGSDFFVLAAEDVSFDEGLSRVSASGGAPVSIGTANSIVITEGCLFAIDYMKGVYSVASSYSP